MIKKVCIGLMVIMMIAATGCTRNAEDSPAPSVVESEAPSVQPTSSIQEDYFGALHVEGSKLRSANGAIVQLKGISSHSLSVFPQFVNKEIMQQMKEEWGCSVIRLAMYTAEENGYCTGDDANRQILKERIDNAVNDAQEAELFIIIDWHMLFDNNPLMYVEEAVAFFGEMAQKYADKAHVIFEICNEPNGDTTWAEVKAYAQRVIPAIREFSDAVILVGTTSWSKDVDIAAADPLKEFDNIMYTLHFYAATHKQELRDTMQNALRAGLPIFVSEFGICEATGSGAIDEVEANAWVELMDAYELSYVMWNLSNKDEKSAMIAPSSMKTYGFCEEDLSQAGKWFVEKIGKQSDAILPMSSVSAAIDGINIQANIVSTWQIDGVWYYKYSFSMHNDTSANINGWNLKIVFNQEIQLSEHWNGVYVVENRMLLITPETYNSILYTGGRIEDVGCIIKSKEGLQLENMAIQ